VSPLLFAERTHICKGVNCDTASGDNAFAESDPFGPSEAGTFESTRNLFISDFDQGEPRDISNHVALGFDPTPWAIGTTDTAASGDQVPVNAEFQFQLDLANPNAVAYLQEGIHQGHVFLGISSLHEASRAGPVTYPTFYSNTPAGSLGQIATLDLRVEVLDTVPLQAGDANQDLSFDQLDLVAVGVAAKYLTGEPATWGEGDWNGAPGGSVGAPPAGDGRFDQRDIIAALASGAYLTGSYAALADTTMSPTAISMADDDQSRPLADALLSSGAGLVPIRPLPEPSTVMMLILGILLAAGMRSRTWQAWWGGHSR
jgi:hypothetical protein